MLGVDEVYPGRGGGYEGLSRGGVGDCGDEADEVEVEDCVVRAEGDVLVLRGDCGGDAVRVAGVADFWWLLLGLGEGWCGEEEEGGEGRGGTHVVG